MKSPKRVLLVDDFEDSRISLLKLLQIEGYEVFEAVDGAQAIDVAISERPDIILMDLSLPVIDGLTAARKIKEIEELSDVPIIALSAHDQSEVQAMVNEAGCVGYVTKPVHLSVLVSLMTKHLSR
jgi:two-component system, cell cycle response regulator DivK